jgi:predicted RNase H-like nuclease (RuvC/YqgF family)
VAEVGKKPKGDYTAGEGSGGPYHSKKSKKELRRAINALLGDNKLLYEKVSALEAKRDELMKDGSTLLGLYQNSVAANNGLATTGADLLIESTRLKAELDEAIKARDELQKRLDRPRRRRTRTFSGRGPMPPRPPPRPRGFAPFLTTSGSRTLVSPLPPEKRRAGRSRSWRRRSAK